MPSPSPSIRIADAPGRIKVVMHRLRAARGALRRFEVATRPLPPDMAAALTRRWAELPDHVRTPAQLLGRRSAGCEGTHGVFPQCNFGCRPCYHSDDANQVRIDGTHTVAAVAEQMAFARSVRGPGQFAQLIGGEVSLLDPDDHAAALIAMWAQDRVPMSFSHGDFDYDYLQRLALGPDGRPRFDQLAFAIHIDTTMIGRRAVSHPVVESDLDGERERVMEMFHRLRRQHGIRSYVAHNMTVTPANLDQVPAVIASCRSFGYRMFSFQPAAYIGHEQRWQPGYRRFGDDDVWARIEAGAGRSLPYRGIQFGDLRCNRVTWGAFVGDRYVPVLDEADQRDLAARDAFFAAFPGTLGSGHPTLKAVRLARSVATQPRVVPALVGWGLRFGRRAGGWRALGLTTLFSAALGSEAGWRSIRPTTFVMHRFMDAADVAAAWDQLDQGRTPAEIADREPALAETAERLAACVYSMAHPETGQMVPACVQHGVLDPGENRALVELLPRRPNRRRDS